MVVILVLHRLVLLVGLLLLRLREVAGLRCCLRHLLHLSLNWAGRVLTTWHVGTNLLSALVLALLPLHLALLFVAFVCPRGNLKREHYFEEHISECAASICLPVFLAVRIMELLGEENHRGRQVRKE